MLFRWGIIAAALLISLFVLFQPPKEGDDWRFDNIGKNISLGLDLLGGIFMQLEVDEEDAVAQYLEEQAGAIKSSLETENEFQIAGSEADADTRVITLKNIRSSKFDNIARELRSRYDFAWNISMRGADAVLRLRETTRSRIVDDAVQQTVYKIQNRVDELGVTEPVINRTIGSNRIVVELAGADDVDRVHKIVREPGKLEWRLVLPGSPLGSLTEEELLAQYGGQAPQGTQVFPNFESPGGQPTYMLLKEVMMTARNVANVYETRDDRGLPAVGISLDRAGGQIFSRETGQNVNELLSIVLDGKIISAPRIMTQLGDRFIIQGQFSSREVQDMVVKIKSGSLPAEVNILEEWAIGPSLGRDAIQQGTRAATIGLVLVVLFILLYYRRAGVYAFIALAMNLILILGMLSGVGAVLTLPGIAGFILTIGMAVDANVLVFERIREELRSGTPVKKAVDTGYRTAFVTIMDANVTTFIAAFCLLLMGEGPVKGFAVMLMIGIVSSIFTAVFCSRTMFLMYLNSKAVIKKLSIWPIWRGQTNPTQ